MRFGSFPLPFGVGLGLIRVVPAGIGQLLAPTGGEGSHEFIRVLARATLMSIDATLASWVASLCLADAEILAFVFNAPLAGHAESTSDLELFVRQQTQ